jgi:hypothetical protein
MLGVGLEVIKKLLNVEATELLLIDQVYNMPLTA